MAVQGRSSQSLLSKREEQAIVEAAGKLFCRGFPNPERIGCPGSQTLQSAAAETRSAPIPMDVLDHLTCCSPCFVEFREYRNQARRRRTGILKAPLLLWLAIATGLWLSGLINIPHARKAERRYP